VVLIYDDEFDHNYGCFGVLCVTLDIFRTWRDLKTKGTFHGKIGDFPLTDLGAYKHKSNGHVHIFYNDRPAYDNTDVVRCSDSRLRPPNRKLKYLLNGWSLRRDYKRCLHIFDHGRLVLDNEGTARGGPTLVVVGRLPIFKIAASKTGR